MAGASSRKDRSASSDEAVYKVVLVGELGAGKSSIFMRFRDDIFHENYDGTRGMDHAVKPINTGNEKISVRKLGLFLVGSMKLSYTMAHGSTYSRLNNLM